MADEHSFDSLLVDRLEAVRTRERQSTAPTIFKARYGRDYDRAVLKAEGEVEDGRMEEARTELLWSHAVAAYWDTQLGVRYDSGADGRGAAGWRSAFRDWRRTGSRSTPLPMSVTRDAARCVCTWSTNCC